MDILLLLSHLLLPVLIVGFKCAKETQHCYTSLVIDYSFTMISEDGPVYAKNGRLLKTENDEEVSIEKVISVDGWNETKYLITANGTMPGPDIFIYQNQHITIRVENKLINEDVTIHWHGIDQFGHPAMDGVAFITQCPIMPGQSFEYTYKPRFGGTYWYHSHVGNQRDMGLFGAFVILRREEPVPLSHQHIIQIQEYNHLYNPITILKASVSPRFHSVLINGRGSYSDIESPLHVFHLEKGRKNLHLFRLIGVGAGEPLLFEIPGFKLKVVETDGYEVAPFEVDKIIVYSAERYNFLLDLSCVEAGIYSITVKVLEGNELKIPNQPLGQALIHITEKYKSKLSRCKQSKDIKVRNRVLNCPFLSYPSEPNVLCFQVSILQTERQDNLKLFGVDGIQSVDETDTHFLNFAFSGGPSINGRKFILPTVNALTQPFDVNTDCSSCTDERPCSCTHSIDLHQGSEVIFVFLNLGKTARSHHPIHMHGHTFEVIKMEYPNIADDGKFIHTNDIRCSKELPNSESACHAASWSNSSWDDYTNIPGINTHNPVRKDTVIVPVGGYVIVRILARNPGLWYMHCHIDRHMVGGMALILNESFVSYNGSDKTFIPSNLPSCHSFLGSAERNEHGINLKSQLFADVSSEGIPVGPGLQTGDPEEKMMIYTGLSTLLGFLVIAGVVIAALEICERKRRKGYQQLTTRDDNTK